LLIGQLMLLEEERMTDVRPDVPGQAPSRSTPARLDGDLRALLPPLDPATRAAVVAALADLAVAALDADAGMLPVVRDIVPAASDRPAQASTP
jgi:hypothetical protein